MIDGAPRRSPPPASAGRSTVQSGDVAGVGGSASDDRYDLVTLINNIYYFTRDERVDLYRQMRGALTDGGELVVVTMVTPGSTASAHLHFMLVSQAGRRVAARGRRSRARPSRRRLRHIESTRLVPTEPFVGIRAR